MEEGRSLALTYTSRARAQLDDILDFLKTRNERSATNVFERIRRACRQVTLRPYSGRAEGPPGVRTISVQKYPYVVMYRLIGDPPTEIEILGVFHTSLGERKL